MKSGFLTDAEVTDLLTTQIRMLRRYRASLLEEMLDVERRLRSSRKQLMGVKKGPCNNRGHNGEKLPKAMNNGIDGTLHKALNNVNGNR